MKGLRLQRPRAERGKPECRLDQGRREGGRKGVDDRGKRGDGISGEKERSVEQRDGTGGGGRGRENGAGDWTDCGTWRNFAQADWTRCTTNQPGLPDSQYEVSRRISCTSAGEHTSRSVIPPSLPTCPLAHPPFPPFLPPRHIYCEEFRFPSVVFPPARPFADWWRISDNITDAGVASVHTRVEIAKHCNTAHNAFALVCSRVLNLI